MFLFAYGNEAVFPYNFTGIEQEVEEDAGINFSILASAIDTTTTYETAPALTVDFGKTQVFPGFNYTVGSFDCGAVAGQKLSVLAASVNGLGLQYFQDDQPSAIGLYVVPCN